MESVLMVGWECQTLWEQISLFSGFETKLLKIYLTSNIVFVQFF